MKMIYFIFSILGLAGLSFSNALIFHILTARRLALPQAYRLTAAAAALNKLLFTGSGFAAASFFSRRKGVSASDAFCAFLVLEVCLVSPWLLAGIYFGARITLRFPVLLIVLLCAAVLFFLCAREKFMGALNDLRSSFLRLRLRVFAVLPYVFFSSIFLFLYYFFLFRAFGFLSSFSGIIKIIAISLSMGYFSPAPAGLGFKDMTMVFLLNDGGLYITRAINLAVADRIVTTLFWAALGGAVSFDLLRQAVKRRFKK